MLKKMPSNNQRLVANIKQQLFQIDSNFNLQKNLNFSIYANFTKGEFQDS